MAIWLYIPTVNAVVVVVVEYNVTIFRSIMNNNGKLKGNIKGNIKNDHDKLEASFSGFDGTLRNNVNVSSRVDRFKFFFNSTIGSNISVSSKNCFC